MKSFIIILSFLFIGSLSVQAQKGKWVTKPGKAKQVIAGGTKAFIIGTDGQLYEWNFAGKWTRAGVYPKSAAVDKNNAIWIVEKNGTIKQFKNGKWNTMPGTAKQVAAGGSKVFIIGTDDQLYEWNFAGKWTRGGVYPKSIAIDKNNALWMVDKNTEALKRFQNGKWEDMSRTATKVFAGGKRVIMIGRDGQMYEWNFAGKWTRGGVYPTSIAIDHKHTIWITKKDNTIQSIGW